MMQEKGPLLLRTGISKVIVKNASVLISRYDTIPYDITPVKSRDI